MENSGNFTPHQAHARETNANPSHLSERRESAMFHIELWRVRVAGVGPRGVTGRGEGHVPDADREKSPQHSQGSAQRVAPLDASK